MSASLVGSEMCIRDSPCPTAQVGRRHSGLELGEAEPAIPEGRVEQGHRSGGCACCVPQPPGGAVA
eukprot:5312253-Alexandrium_andersonii.AAC.1